MSGMQLRSGRVLVNVAFRPIRRRNRELSYQYPIDANITITEMMPQPSDYEQEHAQEQLVEEQAEPMDVQMEPEDELIPQPLPEETHFMPQQQEFVEEDQLQVEQQIAAARCKWLQFLIVLLIGLIAAVFNLLWLQ